MRDSRADAGGAMTAADLPTPPDLDIELILGLKRA